jgi:hypothetical protein
MPQRRLSRRHPTMCVLPMRALGRVHTAVRQVPSLPADQILQQRMPEERMGFPPPLVRRCVVVHVGSPCFLISSLTLSIIIVSWVVHPRILHGAGHCFFFFSIVIFSKVQYLMSDTTTRIPQLLHTTTATQNASIFVFGGGGNLRVPETCVQRRRMGWRALGGNYTISFGAEHC